ncbi:MAG: sugar transferase [Epsilonproteobacteria bacterium]|nr:sugar transferase [Campylobacterota bacterium]
MYCRYFKGFLDRVFALALIIVFFPLMIGIAGVIYFMMGRPILFRQLRPGQEAKVFTIYKFRTMLNSRDNNGELLADDQRLEGIGKLIRSLSLDELPQLFNVLKGDMSFVGPRPLLVEYLPLYNEKQRRRHKCKPGITGWAQVNGRNAISWEKKFVLDIWYVEHCSFWIDLKIFWLTFLKLVKRSDISSTTYVTMEKFKGNE